MAAIRTSLGIRICQDTGNGYEVFVVSDPREKCTMVEVEITLRSGKKEKAGRVPYTIEVWKAGLIQHFHRKPKGPQ